MAFCHLTDGIAAYSVMQTRLRRREAPPRIRRFSSITEARGFTRRCRDIAETHIFRDQNAFAIHRCDAVAYLTHRIQTTSRCRLNVAWRMSASVFADLRGALIYRVPCGPERTGIRREPPASGFRSGGEEGIRTLDTSFPVWRFSKALPSATRPPLRCRSYALNRPAGSNRKVCAPRATGSGPSDSATPLALRREPRGATAGHFPSLATGIKYRSLILLAAMEQDVTSSKDNPMTLTFRCPAELEGVLPPPVPAAQAFPPGSRRCPRRHSTR